jgi:hypothetical protein
MVLPESHLRRGRGRGAGHQAIAAGCRRYGRGGCARGACGRCECRSCGRRRDGSRGPHRPRTRRRHRGPPRTRTGRRPRGRPRGRHAGRRGRLHGWGARHRCARHRTYWRRTHRTSRHHRSRIRRLRYAVARATEDPRHHDDPCHCDRCRSNPHATTTPPAPGSRNHPSRIKRRNRAIRRQRTPKLLLGKGPTLVAHAPPPTPLDSAANRGTPSPPTPHTTSADCSLPFMRVLPRRSVLVRSGVCPGLVRLRS